MHRDYLKWLQIGPDDIILDLGAMLGAFAIHVVSRAKLTVCVEPDRNNFALLKENINSNNSILINKAAVIDGSKKVSLYKTVNDTNHGNYSIVNYRGRTSETVKAVSFYLLLKKYRPSILKVDIEGYEYELLQKKLPEHVRQIALEFHLNRREWKNKLAPSLYKDLKKQGFKAVKKMKITRANWHCTSVLKR